MEEISLQDLFLILREGLKIIIGTIVLSVVAVGLISLFFLKPEYQTSTTLMVGQANNHQSENEIDYNDLLLNEKLVHTYGELVRSRNISETVIESLGLTMSYSTFNEKVNVNPVSKTQMFKIEVIDNDPVVAAQIANETASVFIEKMADLMVAENIQVVDEAQVPNGSISPKPISNMVIASVLGAMVGIFIVFLRELLDRTIKTPEDVNKYLGLSIIGTIPKVKNGELRLVSVNDPKSPITEAYRTLRTNIQFTGIDRELRTIIVTSSTPSEGKSNVAANLAVTIAHGDKKVLLIDCDLRKPNVHRLFGLSSNEGLTNLLLEKKRTDLTLTEGLTFEYGDVDNLNIITSGPIPPNPSELLGSKKMQEFLEEAKKHFDMIILDTPPVGPVTDSAVLSTITDGAIIVAAVNQTNIEDVVSGKELLGKVKANILGVVLNKVPVKEGSSSRYGYYKYYGYYGEDENRRMEEKKRRKWKRGRKVKKRRRIR